MYLKQIASYWDSRAEGYSLSIHEQLGSDAGVYYRDKLKCCAPSGEALSCLDVGCGPGFFSILLAQAGHRVTAVDYSEGMLAQAQENFQQLGVTVETRRGDAQELPFQDGCFDYIVSRNLVWNLESPAEAYREWMRLLKPGGHLLVEDGNHYLYYFDEQYLEARRAAAAGSTHPCYGVDPTPINEIARALPLSREHRPDWDIATLLKLGMNHLEVSVSRSPFTDPDSGEIKSVICDFLLCAEKPAEVCV